MLPPKSEQELKDEIAWKEFKQTLSALDYDFLDAIPLRYQVGSYKALRLFRKASNFKTVQERIKATHAFMDAWVQAVHMVIPDVQGNEASPGDAPT